MKRLTLSIGLLSLAAVLAACSGATASAPPASSPVASGGPAGDVVAVTAKDLKFGQSELIVPADKAFDLAFDNQESAPHNVAIYTDSSASTSISVGEVFSGPGVQKTQSVPALAAGAYFFRCDVHPEMKGTITAQ